MQMVIYGIGSIESYETPRLQLALAILMKKRLSWIGDMEVFDPILSATETRVLETLGCSVLSVNEQGRRQALKPTLFFMPHCEAELYDNLLQANWRVDMLKRVVLFGNSFESYEQYVLVFKNSTVINLRKHILAVRRFTKEAGIKTVSDDYFRAFHDLSWHFFSFDPEMGCNLVS
ncbi:sensitivity to red light reduced protein [Actinidia rufa]|uniref:Sensitivity to red light reduced protein n=1 Tax=Actinidia rufa TaxID=165716 RepID=A0A7J0ES54_9ERIC|nr:sensitivity to red light reduced protein [Actinidia rufa]